MCVSIKCMQISIQEISIQDSDRNPHREKDWRIAIEGKKHKDWFKIKQFN